MGQDAIITVLASLFEVDPTNLSPSTLLESLESYDSVNMLSLMVVLDDEFGVKVDHRDLESFRSVQNIIDFVQSNKKK